MIRVTSTYTYTIYELGAQKKHAIVLDCDM